MKKSLGAKTLLYPTPVLIVGTYDGEGKANMATVAWGGISCSSPPCVSISLRGATYSFHSIMEREAFTVNIPSEKFAKEVDYVGMASGKNVDKFEVTGLTPVKSDLVDAPYVEEFPLILECKLVHKLELGIHTQFTGEILDVKAVEDVLGERDNPNMEKLQPLVYETGFGTYYGIGERVGKAYQIGKEIGD